MAWVSNYTPHQRVLRNVIIRPWRNLLLVRISTTATMGSKTHWNANVVILTKFSSLAASEVVIFTIPTEPQTKILSKYCHFHFKEENHLGNIYNKTDMWWIWRKFFDGCTGSCHFDNCRYSERRKFCKKRKCRYMRYSKENRPGNTYIFW